MQKVELYYNKLKAKLDMEKHIENGWRVHTCTMSCFMAGFEPESEVLVVYEKSE